jgi:hypothetical protein
MAPPWLRRLYSCGQLKHHMPPKDQDQEQQQPTRVTSSKPDVGPCQLALEDTILRELPLMASLFTMGPIEEAIYQVKVKPFTRQVVAG